MSLTLAVQGSITARGTAKRKTYDCTAQKEEEEETPLAVQGSTTARGTAQTKL